MISASHTSHDTITPLYLSLLTIMCLMVPIMWVFEISTQEILDSNRSEIHALKMKSLHNKYHLFIYVHSALFVMAQLTCILNLIVFI